MNATANAQLLPLEPEYRERIWGGARLRRADPPIGEAWIAYPGSRVSGGPAAGTTVGELAAARGGELLGTAVEASLGRRFPLLVKILDCADWLSVQVHPSDEQARRLVGPDEFGKTEAWYFIETAAAARIRAGVRPGTSEGALAAAIRQGGVLDVMGDVEVHAGQAVLVPAGMLHALGPGMLLYEIQQASDTTFRVYDWDRPLEAGRRLHIEESVACATLQEPPSPAAPALPPGTAAAPVVASPYFETEAIRLAGRPFETSADGRSFQVLTVVHGAVEVHAGAETEWLERFDTLLVAAAAGRYRIVAPRGDALVLRATVPSHA